MEQESLSPDRSKPDPDWISVELSSRRTGMSFQRTRLSADRTLMSVVRTSLSLITFGFTIFQAFHQLCRMQVLNSAAAPRLFGQALVSLGVMLLVLGIGYHLTFMARLREERQRMKASGLVHAESDYPISMTLIVAMLLLGVGGVAIFDMFFQHLPFG